MEDKFVVAIKAIIQFDGKFLKPIIDDFDRNFVIFLIEKQIALNIG